MAGWGFCFSTARSGFSPIGNFWAASDRRTGPIRSLVIPYAAILVLGIYVAFHVFMAVPWPPTLLGTLFPALKVIPSV